MKWFSALTFALVLLAITASLHWTAIAYYYKGGAPTFTLQDGVFYISWFNVPFDLGLGDESRFQAYEVHTFWADSWQGFLNGFTKVPSFETKQGLSSISIPIWTLLLLSGLPTGLLWWLDRRRPRPGCCPACGYDLTGNVSGTCPECGRAIESNAAPAQSDTEPDRTMPSPRARE